MSIVSVSRRAGWPHDGQATSTNPAWLASGDSPDGVNSTSSGARTGSWSAGDQPVAQAVVDHAHALTLIGEPGDGRRLGLRHRHAVEESGVDLDPVTREGAGEVIGEAVGRLRRADDGETVGGGEGEVPLVFGRHRHDRTRPVAHEHVVGDVERHRLTGERVDHVTAGKGAPLVERTTLGRGPLDLSGSRHLGLELLHRRTLCVGGQLVDQGVLGGQHGIGHPKAGVGTGGEHPDGQVRPPVHDEVHLGPLGPTDPVALHGLDPLGPLEVVEALKELVGVVGDLEEPLLEVTLEHEVAGALAGAVGLDLLVGEDGVAARAPVHRGIAAVDEPGLQQAEEDRLGPSDVGRIVAAHLTTPIEDRAELADARAQLDDPLVGEDPRVRPGLDRRVLRRQAEGVEPEGRQHPEALHGLVAGDQVAEGVVAHVPLVGRA